MNPNISNNIPQSMRFNSATNVNIYNNLQVNNNNIYNNNLNPNINKNMNINFLAEGATFIFSSIGKYTIINEDFNTFKNNLKSNEWTNNSLYKLAINVPVSPTFNTKKSKNGNLNSNIQNNFNNYLLNLPSYLDDFNSYVNEINNRNTKINEDIETNKNNFISKNLPNENLNIDFNLLLNKISQNKSYILSKDQNLYIKISNLLPLLINNNNQQSQQPLNNNNLSSAPVIAEQKLPSPQQPNNIPNNQAFSLPYQQNQNNVYNNNPQNIYQNIKQPNNNNYAIQPSLYNNVGIPSGNNIYNQQPNTIYNQSGNNNPYVPNNMYKKY